MFLLNTPTMLALSIIIPTLNEQYHLSLLLTQLFDQKGVTLDIVVADGGSTDNTLIVAKQFGVNVQSTRPGRGQQMNQGAQQALYPLLLFLHADSTLVTPDLLHDSIDYFHKSTKQLKTEQIAGHYALKFDRDGQNNELAYHYLEEKTRQNRLYTINGDQGLMILRSYFDYLGGFNQQLHFLEDQFIAKNIFQTGVWITLPGQLHTSARRFEQEGWYQRYLLMGLIMVFFATSNQSFFEHAKDAYRLQNQTKKLKITPFIAISAKTIFKHPSFGSFWALFLGVGKFCRCNLWQIFFWIDFIIAHLRQQTPPTHGQLLNIYDRYIDRALANKFSDAIMALWVLSLFFLVVTPIVWIIEKLKR